MSYYVHQLSPFLWEFAPGFGIRWYGLAYAAGLLAGWGLIIRLAQQGLSPLDARARGRFILYLLLGIVLGGRLGYMLLYAWPQFAADPLIFFQFHRGGMASHGGFVGVAVACWLFARRSRISAWHLCDLTCVIAPLGLFFGRIANFINGELWGKVAQVPWAVVFPSSAPAGTPLGLIAPRHPSQLYEALLEGLLLFIYTQVRLRATRLRPPGALTGEFLILYALARIVGELFRQPDASLILGLSRGTFYSLFMIPLGLGLIWWARRQAPTDLSAKAALHKR